MSKRLSLLILPVLTLVLEILPYGAVCNFAHLAQDGSIGSNRVLFSYFDMIPFGYANFAPFITAIMSCIIFLIVLDYCVRGTVGAALVARNWLAVTAVVSMGPLLYGIQDYSVVGLLITLSLFAEAFLLHWKFGIRRK